MSQVKDRRVELTLEQKRTLVARLLKEKAAGRTTRGLVHRWFEIQAARHAGGDRGDRRATIPHLRPAQRPRQPPGPAAPRHGRRPRGPRRPLHRPVGATWSPRCSPSSRRAVPTSRSTRPIPPTASPSCWPTPEPRSWSPRSDSAGDCPSVEAHVVCLDSDADSHRRGERREPRRKRRPGEPGLRDLHLGLDRRAQGRPGHATPRSPTCSPRCAACSASPPMMPCSP